MIAPFLKEYWFLQAGQCMMSLPAELLPPFELLPRGLRRMILQEGHLEAVRPEEDIALVDFNFRL